MAALRLAFSLLACLAIAAPCAALHCWSCSSNQDKGCRDPFNNTRLQQMNCQSPSPYSDHAYCQKLITSINGGEMKTVRKCIYSRDPLNGGCPDQPSNYITVEHCSTCDNDLCNGSPGTLGSLAAASATAVALVSSWLGAYLLR